SLQVLHVREHDLGQVHLEQVDLLPQHQREQEVERSLEDLEVEVERGGPHHRMAGPTAARARGRARPSSSRTQGDALGGTKGESEDTEMRRYSRVIRVRGVVGPAIFPP